jgi:uncharacterized SAM-binding protein YcdF (DUF218 family)
MNEVAGKRRRRNRWPLGLLAVLLAAVGWLLLTCSLVARESWQHEVKPADVIIVFGAAEYAGRPSPVYRARLDHAFELFQNGIARVVITTGGAGDDPHYSEGGVGHDYLLRRGIPDHNLIAETQGSDTAESARRVAVIMRTNRMRSCIAVSDAYHAFRIRKLLQHEGVQVSVAPRPDSRPRSAKQRAAAVLREALSYMAWRLHLRF